MEIIEVKSAHALTSPAVETRPEAPSIYQLNCRQFISVYESWLRENAEQKPALGVMTLASDRIWMTGAEGRQVADAIQAAISPVMLE